jgi:hypothetical protein
LPDGWQVNFDCGFGQPQEVLDEIWNDTITDVDQVVNAIQLWTRSAHVRREQIVNSAREDLLG